MGALRSQLALIAGDILKDGGFRKPEYAPRETALKEAVSALITPPRQSQVSADLARAHFYLESLPAPVAED